MSVLSFLSLGICLLWLLALGIKERFKDRGRNLATGVLTIILLLAFFQPFAYLINELEGKDIFIAQREGSANCVTYFKLKENNRFIDEDICFGIWRVEGKYQLKNDTIYFQNVELGQWDKPYYEYAVIRRTSKSDSDLGTLTRYLNNADTTTSTLWVVKNELSLITPP